jgi:hypothetical protein
MPILGPSPRHPEGLKDGSLKRGAEDAFAFVKSWKYGLTVPVVGLILYLVTPEPLLGLLAPFLVAAILLGGAVALAPYRQRDEAREALADYHREERELAERVAAEYRKRVGL